jgi:hypothetical protein
LKYLAAEFWLADHQFLIFQTRMKSKKAQAWGFDLTMAVIIFLSGMVVFFLYVLNFPSEQEEIFNVLSYEGKLVGDSLLSEGFPDNWDENSVFVIGVLSGGQVNETKFKNFYDLVSTDYLRSKRLFNIRNDYYVFFEEPIAIDGVNIEGVGVIPGSQKNLVRITRVVVHDNKIKDLHIYVWN